MDRKYFLSLLGSVGIATPGGLFTGSDTSSDSKKIIKPKKLSEGDTIGLISPASIIPERGRYDEIQSTIEKLGFNVRLGEHALEQTGYFAGNDKQRAADLNAMFEDPEIDAILPFRGGWGFNRILKYIDFKAIKKNSEALGRI
ncbi:MAG: LD-carboxypeptidase [Balneolaceae bacterium]|nr:LD-carboxypeptidase [Balneolaceae bacterium]